MFEYENSHAKPANKHRFYLIPHQSLKSAEFPIHAVARNSDSKHFHSNALSFQIKL